MKVSDIMTRGALTVAADSTVVEAAQLMLKHRISGVPVVDARGVVIGMLTEGDLLRRTETGTERRRSRWLELLLGPGRLAGEYVHAHAGKVGGVMTHRVVSVAPETSLEQTVALMEGHRIKRLPVIDHGRLVGIISRANLLRALVDAAVKAHVAASSDRELCRLVLAEIDRQSWTPRVSIDVLVKDGVVELRGAITDERVREALRVATENIPGVKAVRDSLVWVEPISGMAIDH